VAEFAVGPETASPSQVRYMYDERGPQKSTGVQNFLRNIFPARL